MGARSRPATMTMTIMGEQGQQLRMVMTIVALPVAMKM